MHMHELICHFIRHGMTELEMCASSRKKEGKSEAEEMRVFHNYYSIYL